MEGILKELGWNDGFRMPVANEENRALELEIQKKHKEKDRLKITLEDLSDRVASMKKHLGNVHHQLDINQNLIYAQNNQKGMEENLTKLARVEDSSLTNEIKKLKKEEKDVQERLNKVQADVDRVFQRVERLNAVIKWDKDALLAWDEEVSRGGDDTMMLERFRREDEAKFKELELKRQTLGAEAENKRNRLLSLKNEVLSLEQSLSKTAQMFRRHHNDRMILVQQWEGSVRILHQRDDDINRVMEEIANLKLLGRERLKDLEEQKTFFENEQRNNLELEKEMEILNEQIYTTREKTTALESILFEEQDQLASFKTVLARATMEHNKVRNEIKVNLNLINKKNEFIADLKAQLEKVERDYEKYKSQIMTGSERVHHLEEILKEEQKQMEKNVFALKKLDELVFQVSQQISELKEGEKTQDTTIQHIRTNKVMLQKYIAKAKTEFNRQKESLYNMDFAYLEKDILFRKLVGESKDEDSEKYEKKISELEMIHSKLTSTHSLLTKEVQRLDDEMRRINVDRQFDAKEQDFLRNKRQELILLIDGGQKQLDALKIKNQDSQVDENVLKLRVKQSENAIDKVGGKVFSLEKQRLELDEAMKEREIEIKTMKDILTVRKRVLTEQTANLNTRINLAKVKVDHMKSKFEVSLSKLGKNDIGEPVTVTEMKMKAAQERFGIQEEGDKLDSKIKKTEKEIEAMENTLQVVNATNAFYKNSLQSVDSNSEEYKEKEKLDKEYIDLMAEYRKKKAILEGVNLITLDLEEEYQQKLNQEKEILNQLEKTNAQVMETGKELKEQEEKLHRAEKQLKKLIKEIRGTTMQKFQTDEEKEVELKELMEQNEYGLQQLAELVAKTYDTSPVVMQYLAEKGMTLPMIKSPNLSVKCPSTASMPSSARSSATAKSQTSSKSFSSVTSKSSQSAVSASVVTVQYPDQSQMRDRKVSEYSKFSKKVKEIDLKKKGSK